MQVQQLTFRPRTRTRSRSQTSAGLSPGVATGEHGFLEVQQVGVVEELARVAVGVVVLVVQTADEVAVVVGQAAVVVAQVDVVGVDAVLQLLLLLSE